MSDQPVYVTRLPRVAIFIEGWNFKYATYDSFGVEVDFTKLLAYLTEGALLLRAYYYSGDWTTDAIEQYIKVTNPEAPDQVREQLRRQAGFFRFLNRNGYMVVRKPMKIHSAGEMKANFDLEMAIDMLNLAERCDQQILVSGDGDFVPVVRAVAARGVRVTVLSTQSGRAYERCGYRASDELLDAADDFIEVADILEKIRR